MFEVAVIGAGVVGGLVARELTKYTKAVCILEAEGDVALGATRANSAIVHAGFDAAEGSMKARFNVRGSEMMESLCEELGVKYNRCGSLVVGFTDEDKETLASLLARGEKNGVRELSLLSGEEVRAIEPNIGPGVTSALLAGTGAIVCPYELCMAAVGSAMDNGAELLLSFKVDKIEKADGFYRVYAGERCVEAKYIVNCAGVFSDEIATLVGDDRFTVRARRGEYMLLDRECGGLVSRTVFRCPSKMGKGILVTPTVDGNLLLGPTAEDIDDKTDTRTTASGLAKVRALASEQVSGIDFSKVITSFSGLRATGSTGDFVIDMPREGFVNVAAVESPGLSSAPAIAEYVAELLIGAGAELVLRSDFSGARLPMHWFSSLTVDEKNEVIKNSPEFAHIICRCEMITEGEILYALRTNPKPTDLDGVKRRTRASMGRCQGGFCSPYIVELLANELGIAYEDVTKFGGKSKINVARTKEGV